MRTERCWKRSAAVLLALTALVCACGDRSAVNTSMARRPMTTDEFFELVVGQHQFTGESGSHFGFSDDPPTFSGFDGCNSFSGPLVFIAGEVVFPEEGLVGTDMACPGVSGDGGGWVFGRWMVDPDGSVVVVATRDGSEHAITDIVVPDPAGSPPEPSTTAPARRPMTKDEFFDVIVGHHFVEGASGAQLEFDINYTSIQIFDGCNSLHAPLRFVDGTLVRPDGGLESGEYIDCNGVEEFDFPWIFGEWVVEPDRSVVVISTLTGEEHPLPDIKVPWTRP